MGHLWHELTNRRHDERTISYAESHDQALVGDQSIIFRLIGADMYWHMQIGDDHLGVDRGMSLHKMIRLITLATAGSGYLNFMATSSATRNGSTSRGRATTGPSPTRGGSGTSWTTRT